MTILSYYVRSREHMYHVAILYKFRRKERAIVYITRFSGNSSSSLSASISAILKSTVRLVLLIGRSDFSFRQILNLAIELVIGTRYSFWWLDMCAVSRNGPASRPREFQSAILRCHNKYSNQCTSIKYSCFNLPSTNASAMRRCKQRYLRSRNLSVGRM